MKKISNFMQLYLEAQETDAGNEEWIDAMASDTKIILNDKPYKILFKTKGNDICIQNDEDMLTWYEYDPTQLAAKVIDPPEKVDGRFYIPGVKSLVGCPRVINGDFECTNCPELKTLEGGPEEVTGYYNCCQNNGLESLKGVAKIIGGDFNCHKCDSLKSFDGLQETEIGNFFICSYLKDMTIDGLKGLPPPENINVGKRKHKKPLKCDIELIRFLEASKEELGKLKKQNEIDNDLDQILININGWLDRAEANSSGRASVSLDI